MSAKPTFLFVPGNFLPPAYYATAAELLESHSFPTKLVTLASTGSSKPLSSNEPDIAEIRKILDDLVYVGKEVIVVAHSYAGVPTCEAVKGLGRQERLDLGKSGGVVKLVFVSAWVLQEGEGPPTIIERHDIDGSWARFDGVNVYAEDPVYALHNDTSKEVAAYWAPYVTHSDLTAFATPLQFAAWRHIPSTYVICELDKCAPPHAQEGMVALTDGKVKAERLASGHMPMLSMPEKFVEVLEKETLTL